MAGSSAGIGPRIEATQAGNETGLSSLTVNPAWQELTHTKTRRCQFDKNECNTEIKQLRPGLFIFSQLSLCRSRDVSVWSKSKGNTKISKISMTYLPPSVLCNSQCQQNALQGQRGCDGFHTQLVDDSVIMWLQTGLEHSGNCLGQV